MLPERLPASGIKHRSPLTPLGFLGGFAHLPLRPSTHDLTHGFLQVVFDCEVAFGHRPGEIQLKLRQLPQQLALRVKLRLADEQNLLQPNRS